MSLQRLTTYRNVCSRTSFSLRATTNFQLPGNHPPYSSPISTSQRWYGDSVAIACWTQTVSGIGCAESEGGDTAGIQKALLPDAAHSAQNSATITTTIAQCSPSDCSRSYATPESAASGSASAAGVGLCTGVDAQGRPEMSPTPMPASMTAAIAGSCTITQPHGRRSCQFRHWPNSILKSWTA